MPVHTDSQCLDSSDQKEGVKGAKNSARGLLNEGHAFGQRLVVDNRKARDHESRRTFTGEISDGRKIHEMFSNNPEFRGRNTGFQFNPLTHHTMRTYYQMISSLEYEPKDRHFTSEEEIEMLDKHFGLAGMSLLDLQNLRDIDRGGARQVQHTKHYTS